MFDIIIELLQTRLVLRHVNNFANIVDTAHYYNYVTIIICYYIACKYEFEKCRFHPFYIITELSFLNWGS